MIGHFEHYPVRNCRICKHSEHNPQGNCNYSDARVYISGNGKKMMVSGKCAKDTNERPRSTTAFYDTNITFKTQQ